MSSASRSGGHGVRLERLVAQVARSSARVMLMRSRDVEHAADLVDVALRVELERLHELGERRRRRVARDLEAHGVAALAPPELLLDRLQQVLGLLLVDLDVEVARDAEDVEPLDARAGEDGARRGGRARSSSSTNARVAGCPSGRLHARDREEARQHRRHLHDAEPVLERPLAREHDAEVQALVSHLRERVARVDRDRREDREDLVVEARVELARAPRARARSA